MRPTPSTRLIGVIREAYGLDMSGHHVATLLDCLSALDKDAEKAADDVLRSASRLSDLVECATNNETYFFRHPEQLTALQSLVADSLVKNPRPALRVWVAGCSSGEEPLSIAALLRETLMLFPGTSLSVLGTDLNRAMLRKAGKDYTMWSFRGVPAALRAAHFVEQNGRYKPSSALESLVRYRRHNLLEGPPEAVPFDVVSCRNVLIYFDTAMVKRAIDLLSLAVAPGGLLLLGPVESPSVSLSDFETVFHEGVALFRRKSVPTIGPLKSAEPPRAVGRRATRGLARAPVRAPVVAPPKSGVRPPAIPQNAPLQSEAQVFDALATLERGDSDAAIERLRAVIAADADNAMAHYLVGSILESRGERDAAEQFYQHALAALNDLDPALAVPCGGGITVEELVRFLGGVLQSDPRAAT